MRDPDAVLDADAESIADGRARLIEAELSRAGLGLVLRMGDRGSGLLLDRLVRLLAIRHPRAFVAMREMPDARVLIEPTDARVALLLRVGPELSLRLRPCQARKDGAAATDGMADAVISGPYARLLDLLEGRIDGDALFFRRELSIAGDTALIVALRNTLDGEEMDLLADALSFAGPLASLLPVLRRNAGPLLDRLADARRLLPPPLKWGIARIEARLPGFGPGREA
ncbi:ubiquinone anaerobic biosynthesis accessory factor UbiT [Azospirillum picis]|uniref:Lipid carrier protein YhbT n=1 Tax=Azospirillum picis TaxID=488438 RepID=A0ABU0MP05_9PROT|nr:SCP2 sterol-binding domain-containing protein [Azospirillum picis]MBP2301152.1 putative lipid carrier protein YhbT [Azospirillum picis]MDQ0534886.1 putative lipid carrier protein YhbT [Azospirillum picis]